MSDANDPMQQAMSLHRAGRLDEAAQVYRSILAVNPRHPDALHLLGLVVKANEPAAAEDLIRRAMEIRPDYEIYHNSLGEVLRAQRRIDEAIAEYRAAIRIKGDYVSAINNLSLVLLERGDSTEAIALTQQVIQLEPRNLKAHNRLGVALVEQGQFAEAIAVLQTAIRIDPNYSKPYINLGNALAGLGDAELSVQCQRAALKLEPANAAARDNLLFTINYLPQLDRQTIFEEHRRYDEIHAGPLLPADLAHPNSPDPDRPLRIGYVSPDFADHAVAFFIAPILAQHDRKRFSVFCYSSVRRADAVTRRLRSLCGEAGWRDVFALTDDTLAEQIRRDQIDILIDLAEHTTGNRLLAFARKPAPVQVTYLGYPQTTGLSAIDYKLTDPVIDPPGDSDRYHSEKIAHLPDTYFCYAPRADTPEVGDGPVEDAPPTFVSINAMLKINPLVLATWASLLERVPDARLLIKGKGLETAAGRERMLELCRGAGLAMERVEIVPSSNFVDFLRFFDRAHVALDPFPYNGGTTTCHTLWMGVPVVTLAGDRSVSRMGASVLGAIGLRELVAASPAQYVDIAAALVTDRARVLRLRRSLRQRMQDSPVLDAAGFTRHIESAYRQMWRTWCATQRPSGR